MNAKLHQRTGPRCGFTLVEIFIVISLMAIMAGLVIPAMLPDLAQHLDSTAEVVSADLARARSIAVANNSSYRLTFDTTANQYTLEHTGINTALNTLPRSPFGRTTDAATTNITRLNELPQAGPPVRLHVVRKRTAAGVESTVTTVEFGPLGETTRPESTIVWLAAGSGSAQRFISLTVDPVTGLVSVGAMTDVAPGNSTSGGS